MQLFSGERGKMKGFGLLVGILAAVLGVGMFASWVFGAGFVDDTGNDWDKGTLHNMEVFGINIGYDNLGRFER